jgi:hypothetical protein
MLIPYRFLLLSSTALDMEVFPLSLGILFSITSLVELSVALTFTEQRLGIYT